MGYCGRDVLVREAGGKVSDFSGNEKGLTGKNYSCE